MRRIADALLDALEAADQIVGGLLPAHLAVREADEVREHDVAEDRGDLLALDLHPVRLVEELRILQQPVGIADHLLIERARKHPLVADHPLHALVREQGHDLRADRLFRRPHAGRPVAEMTLEEVEPLAHLRLRILRILEARFGQRKPRTRHARRLGIDQEGQDGVVEGRRGQLHLARLGEALVGGDDAADQLALLADDQLAIGLGEVAPPLDQGQQVRIGLLPEGIEPRQVEPDREVHPLLDVELANGLLEGELGEQRVAFERKLAVARMLDEHAIPVEIEEALEKVALVVEAVLAHRHQRQLERAIDGAVVTVVDQLLQQGRHEVEGLVQRRELLQELRHVEVVLDGMQAHPRHEVLARQAVLVEGLMHVPDDGNAEL
ncbi:hypothetical protein D3C86_1326020 [compost metagenome]